MQPFRLEGAPAWTLDERFDIAAKAAGPISDTERRLMMRALLVERFRLKAHFETREKTIYIMTLARADKQLGPGLKPRPECATRRACRVRSTFRCRGGRRRAPIPTMRVLRS